MVRLLFIALFLLPTMTLTAHAQLLQEQGQDLAQEQEQTVDSENNTLDDLNPFDPNIDETLQNLDTIYQEETGISPFIENLLRPFGTGCFRDGCPVWVQVSKSRQELYLYLNGVHSATWAVSTGAPGHGTPNFDTNPNGRIYDKYSSTKYPGGDYKGLGNMPYAVFISGGFAIHGTGTANWKKLGTRASHGCVRVHPDNALYFNRLVRQHGIYKVWITVQE
ncbi:L,D-transpeptidase family protein [Bdellovibrio svalbardensis]|uniref:L,D-transpeptidase n=1 Tax=Bdellovibrio svalbardensis TaxID=2972972 RepID=A0ABT6DNA5_9BACT|nr:L,D-transpeptidase family protein [Bdellovibrio svalbardensis]MDG0817306.1 L,D-transpeptidase [Bdellovibrio svalbardensis]